jgi:D-arabinose 1-dehydrogenase-like Zn-dependent alcohol dehydrogenase
VPHRSAHHRRLVRRRPADLPVVLGHENAGWVHAVGPAVEHLVHADGQQAPQVRDLTGSGADAVFDFVGEDSTIGDCVAMLRPGGTYYLVGYPHRTLLTL